MKPGTKAIIGYLSERPVRFTRQQWADLVDDIAKLGRENFLHLAARQDGGEQAARKSAKTELRDELLARMTRYRKKSGLDTRAFIGASHVRASGRLGRQPSKAMMRSAPKYLSYLRQWLGNDEIENIFAGVLADHA
jgi:hypothetical protein